MSYPPFPWVKMTLTSIGPVSHSFRSPVVLIPVHYTPLLLLLSISLHPGFYLASCLRKIATVPTEEELYSVGHPSAMLADRMAPDLQRRVDARRAARLAMEKEATQQAEAQTREEQDPDSQRPIWTNPASKR
ncbi:hypothetical protein CPB85DRAFT_1247973 [Mucidula mucida]|nr:hypothetical protein CPB85DRAFT_1247973 [Mucidula mucida]